MPLVTVGYRARVRELLALFAGREEFPDIGQLSAKDKTRLQWALKHRLVWTERRPWPGPLVGTCIKTWYIRCGF